ncbi:Hydrogenase maturation protease [Caloramator fervidus]|uniref:Hydrogenase maturation protease n=2 Tax=Caloramator fervidus TaxID=29344 RepID=A0A1H5VMN3_9CLOT|nr:Hydrogenase maturation protease [Caloramator fervidus]
MGDDGISIYILKRIKDRLEDMNIKVFIVETDINFLIDIVEENDILIIVDALLSKGKVGSVNVFKPMMNKVSFCHSYIPWHIILNKAKEVFEIGIEVENIEFKIGLGKALEDKIDDIADDVLNSIKKLSIH